MTYYTEVSPTFEVVLLDRDKNGLPTGKKVNFASDSAERVSNFYEQHLSLMIAKQGKNKKNKKNSKKVSNKND